MCQEICLNDFNAVSHQELALANDIREPYQVIIHLR